MGIGFFDASGFVPLRALQGLRADLRVAARRLLAAPAFTAFAVISLGVGVGITTAAYSIVDRVFWPETGVREPGRVVFVMSAESGAVDPRLALSAPDFEDLRAGQRSFLAVASSMGVAPAVATSAGTTIEPGEGVDASYFPLLGVDAVVGRMIQEGDAHLQVVVLGHEFWRSRWSSNPGAIGQTVRIAGRPFEIIGVLPESFGGPIGGSRATRFWVPLASAAAMRPETRASTTPERERRRLMVLGRLRPDRTPQQAGTELAVLAAGLDAAHPRTRVVAPNVRPLQRRWTVRTLVEHDARGDLMRRMGLVALALVALVLLVACTNLASLVLARGTVRHQEFAVRRALGASRWRLVRQQLTESALVAAGGAMLSVAVFAILNRALDVEMPVARSWFVSLRPEIDLAALGVAGSALLVSLLVVGLEPAVQLTRARDVRQELAAGAGSVGVPNARRQRMLLRWQVAVSTGFFVIATLCVRYVVTSASHDPGLELGRMGVATVDFYAQRWDEPRARLALERVLEALRREPGVEAAAASTGLPFGTTTTPRAFISTPDKPLTDGGQDRSALLIAATPGLFRAAGISILRGRGFTDRDEAASTPVVVLSEATARTLCGTVDAVGRQVAFRVDLRFLPRGGDLPLRTATIVGIAENTDTSRFLSRDDDTVYAPLAQVYSPWVTLVGRASRPDQAVRALRDAVRRADPDLAIAEIGGGRSMLAAAFVFLQDLGVGALALGFVTLLLAMVGLYGVQSHIVAHRTREIGVRVSFGATASQIRWMVLGDGYRPVIQGLAIGLAIGLAGRAIVRSTLDGSIGLLDPWMLVTVPVPLILAAFFACDLPARRASKVDPSVALREL